MLINYSIYSDQRLIEISKSKKKERDIAFLELYKRYSRSVFQYCKCKFFKNEKAKEIFEEVFIECFKAIKSEKEIKNVQSYLFGIVKNKLASHIRKTNYDKHKDEFNLISINEFDDNESLNLPKIDERNNYENEEFLMLLNEAIELLDAEEKDCYKLNKFGGMSASQIAALMEMNININRRNIAIHSRITGKP